MKRGPLSLGGLVASLVRAFVKLRHGTDDWPGFPGHALQEYD
jgi:hypothetical protein